MFRTIFVFFSSCSKQYTIIDLLILTDANTTNGSPMSNNQELHTDHTESSNHNDESIASISPTITKTVDNNEKDSTSKITPSTESQTEIKETPQDGIQPQRKRRKNVPSSKISRPVLPSSSIIPNNMKLEKSVHQVSTVPTNTTSSTSTTTTTAATNNNTPATTAKTNTAKIVNLIRSLLEEKQFDNHDENLISTIDCLIDSLQHLRERIKSSETINNDSNNNDDERNSSSRNNHHDDSSPLNLSKPKKRNHTRLASANSDDMSPSTTTVSSPSPSAQNLSLASTFFPSQAALYYEKPFFPPFSGKASLFIFILPSRMDYYYEYFLLVVPNLSQFQNHLKLSPSSMLNDSIVCIKTQTSFLPISKYYFIFFIFRILKMEKMVLHDAR